MKKVLIGLVIVLGFAAAASLVAVQASAANSGEAMFKAHCAMCHPDGGNVVNPQKTLHKKDREANKVKTAADIVHLMRHPGPGMMTFDPKTIPDQDAHAIAEYVLKTF